MILFVDDEDVAKLVTMDDALVSVRSAFIAQGLGKADNAPRQKVRLPSAILNVMGGALELPEEHIAQDVAGGWLGAKISVAAGNRKQSWFLLFDDVGTLRCVLVANRLGQLRTGAATAVSTEVLGSPSATRLACLGAGYQAWGQVEAAMRARPIEHVDVWSRNHHHAQAFAGRIREKLGLSVTVGRSPAETVQAAHIVVTITATSSPILSGADVRSDAHVVLAGSNNPQRREADEELFRRATAVYTDDVEQARMVSGDLRMAVAEKALRWSDVRLLGPVVVDIATGQPGIQDTAPKNGITVFCSQGIGSWDVSLAADIFARASAAGLGTLLPIDGSIPDART